MESTHSGKSMFALLHFITTVHSTLFDSHQDKIIYSRRIRIYLLFLSCFVFYQHQCVLYCCISPVFQTFFLRFIVLFHSIHTVGANLNIFVPYFSHTNYNSTFSVEYFLGFKLSLSLYQSWLHCSLILTTTTLLLKQDKWSKFLSHLIIRSKLVLLPPPGLFFSYFDRLENQDLLLHLDVFLQFKTLD